MSRQTETAYNAQSPGEFAQHNKAQGSGDRVNAVPPRRDVAKVHVLIRGDLSNSAVRWCIILSFGDTAGRGD